MDSFTKPSAADASPEEMKHIDDFIASLTPAELDYLSTCVEAMQEGESADEEISEKAQPGGDTDDASGKDYSLDEDDTSGL